MFSLIEGYRFHILALSRRPLSRDEIQAVASELARLPRLIGVPVQTHIIANSLVGRDPQIIQAETNQVFDAYGMSAETREALYLIRPDGYVAFRSNRLEFQGLKDFVGCFAGGHAVY